MQERDGDHIIRALCENIAVSPDNYANFEKRREKKSRSPMVNIDGTNEKKKKEEEKRERERERERNKEKGRKKRRRESPPPPPPTSQKRRVPVF